MVSCKFTVIFGREAGNATGFIKEDIDKNAAVEIRRMDSAGGEKRQRMEFRRIGGSYQLVIRNAGDLRRLLELDESHWALNSVAIASLRGDELFYHFLDDDMDRQIRTDEVRRAVGWFLAMLKDFSGFEQQSNVLELDAIDDSTPEGAQLLDAAKLVLSNLGHGGETRLSLEQIRNDKEIVACARQNGDGIIPPDAAGTPETAALVAAIMQYIGSIKDICGAEGVNTALLDQFATAATAWLNWIDAPASSPETLKPFGDATAAGYAAFATLENEFDTYFIACDACRFGNETPGRLAKIEATVDPLNNQAVRDFFNAAPLAEPRTDGTFDCSGKLNPHKRDAILSFMNSAFVREYACGTVLTLENWNRLKARFAPYAAWMAAKPGTAFDGCAPEQLRRWTSPEQVGALRAMIAADLAAAPRIGACERLHKLILFQRYLLEFLNNFVNLSLLLNPESPSLLQAGRLVMDGRSFTLALIVNNPAEHKAIVKPSDICVIYLDAVTGKPDALRTMKLAVAVTSGNIRNFFLHKHGIFFSADGEVWDAKITDLIQQPVSISEALRMPFYKFGEFISGQADRFFSTKSSEAQKQLGNSLNTAASAAVAPPTAAPVKAQTPAVSGSMMLMGGGIGIAALGSSIAFIVKSLANISIWNVLAVLFGIILVFGGPVVAVSLVKLYRRNLSRFLEANGCAVNRPMRLSRRMGAIFSFVPPIPDSHYLRRDLVDLFQRRPHRKWLVRLLLILLFAALCGAAGYWGFHRCFHPESGIAESSASEKSTDASQAQTQ